MKPIHAAIESTELSKLHSIVFWAFEDKLLIIELLHLYNIVLCVYCILIFYFTLNVPQLINSCNKTSSMVTNFIVAFHCSTQSLLHN